MLGHLDLGIVIIVENILRYAFFQKLRLRCFFQGNYGFASMVLLRKAVPCVLEVVHNPRF